MYDFGLIGNCQVSALIARDGAVRWLCMPRPDAPPIFGSLLDPFGGHLSAAPVAYVASSQSYRKNTNILETRFDGGHGEGLTVTDFCPRFEQHGRMVRPAALFRILTPTTGGLRITLSCLPVMGWEKTPAVPIIADGQLRYELPGGVLHIVTNMPLTYMLEQTPFLLQEQAYLAVLWDSEPHDDIERVSLEYLERTEAYWRRWVKHCSIPTLFQGEVIRSALALKLHCYEDTGAIIAATTTSMPEQIGGDRNWDYRFCWLRDAFFTLSAFHALGHFEEMEGFLRFLLDIVDYRGQLAPLYAIDRHSPLVETIHENWTGFAGSTPVRSGNAAADQLQNDVYGELILVLVPIYLDERFHHLRSPQLARTLLWLAERCRDLVGEPDAGLWELRGIRLEHSFTNLMCWAGLDRTLTVLARGDIVPPGGAEFIAGLEKARAYAEERIIASTRDQVVTNSPGDATLDASLLLLPIVRFPHPEICRRTVDAIAAELGAHAAGVLGGESFLFRYRRRDDFGEPQDAFIICSFWLAQAYARLGLPERGIRIIEDLAASANESGLLSEHYSLHAKQQLGNFPQAYSHVGLVNAAFAVSASWWDVL